jgi:hypothetical protein
VGLGDRREEDAAAERLDAGAELVLREALKASLALRPLEFVRQQDKLEPSGQDGGLSAAASTASGAPGSLVNAVKKSLSPLQQLSRRRSSCTVTLPPAGGGKT